MPSPNLSELVTTTLRNRQKVITDNVSNNNALLMRLKQRGRSKTFGGGRTIAEELSYAENGTYTRYSGYETLNISPSDVLSAAEYNIKQVAVAVSISGLEELQNSGDEGMIDLLESRIEVAEDTLSNNMSVDIYSDGTADGGKQINGLQALVSGTPTSGTVGGIDRATHSFWQNYVYDFSAESVTASASTIQTAMNKAMINTSRGNDTVDLIVADNNYYEFYLNSLQTIQRITSADSAQAGFQSLKFMNADVVLDGGYGGQAPTDSMFFLNTKHLKLKSHKDRNFVPLNPDRFAVNQDAMVKMIGWAGNLCMSNAFVQGKIQA